MKPSTNSFDDLIWDLFYVIFSDGTNHVSDGGVWDIDDLVYDSNKS